MALDLNDVAGTSVYLGAKNLMAYAQLCLIAEEIERWAETYCRRVCDRIKLLARNVWQTLSLGVQQIPYVIKRYQLTSIA